MKLTLLFTLIVILFTSCLNKPRITPPDENTQSLLDTCDTKPCLENIIKIYPSNELAHWRLGQKYQQEKEYKKALEEFTTVIELNSNFNLGYPYRDRANCRHNLGDNYGAIEDMHKAIKLNPNERYFFDSRAHYYNGIKEYELAITDYSQALEIFDRFKYARLGRARTYIRLKQYQESLNDFNKISDVSDFSYYDYYLRGLAKINCLDTLGACSDINKTIELNPEHNITGLDSILIQCEK